MLTNYWSVLKTKPKTTSAKTKTAKFRSQGSRDQAAVSTTTSLERAGEFYAEWVWLMMNESGQTKARDGPARTSTPSWSRQRITL